MGTLFYNYSKLKYVCQTFIMPIVFNIAMTITYSIHSPTHMAKILTINLHITSNKVIYINPNSSLPLSEIISCVQGGSQVIPTLTILIFSNFATSSSICFGKS